VGDVEPRVEEARDELAKPRDSLARLARAAEALVGLGERVIKRREAPPTSEPVRPRLLSLQGVAAYTGYSVDQILKKTRSGEFPLPLRPFGEGSDPRWDVRRVDQWIDAMARGNDEALEIATRVFRRGRARP